MVQQSRYPAYDVMDEASAWDDHTQSIVSARLVREHGWRFVTAVEAETLRAVCSALVDDRRSDIIDFVVGHIDDKLHADKGEGQRKAGVPLARELLRGGLKALDDVALARCQLPYMALEDAVQLQLLEELADSRLTPAEAWDDSDVSNIRSEGDAPRIGDSADNGNEDVGGFGSQARTPVPQHEFFQKLLTLTVEAYYSHPKVWSGLGYGGPAYPRGYVRTQLGQLDPWEAKPE